MFEWTSIDPVVTEMVKNQGQQAGNTLDQIARDIYQTGSNARYANGKSGRSSIAATDVMNGTEIKKAVRTLDFWGLVA